MVNDPEPICYRMDNDFMLMPFIIDRIILKLYLLLHALLFPIFIFIGKHKKHTIFHPFLWHDPT